MRDGIETRQGQDPQGLGAKHESPVPTGTRPNSGHLEGAEKRARELRPEVLAFAHLMERQLRANDHKPGWKRDDPMALFGRIGDEAEELHDAVQAWGANIAQGMDDLGRGADAFSLEERKDAVGKEAADVANFAMMIADRCGALELPAALQSVPEVGEAVPASVYYDAVGGNFYGVPGNVGMGLAFWSKWYERRAEFPTSAHDAAQPSIRSQAIEDTKLLDALRDESWDLRCFDMPTGGGDADIGWRVIGHWMAEPQERTVAEVYVDDPRAAIRAALRSLNNNPGEVGK